jgi:hypothetical protein
MEFIMSPTETATAQTALKHAGILIAPAGTRAADFAMAEKNAAIRAPERDATARILAGNPLMMWRIVIITSILFTLLTKLESY